ncbi:sulfite reductase (ferredoxin) [Saccharopolyspora lacisalsi]|uniref:assimilatory sulfite reductase (ferredoxin) n=1 Tax=Halosaccharopolyspora lacisalsi TaxID=1000566 RepID=A0A839E171_9PSEU|nr:nitrite/sulfite reductase [Halosaccharopolyspora lacisalsi]MBA8825445.1 sulfite reductase (ferredoxin) [Halosaccharopolyspora lacisalsi]
MVPPTEAPSQPQRRTPARKGKSRGEGQWALGHREPLNGNERSKKDDNPLNVRQRIENIYAYKGFDSIDPADLRGRFRWWGLYTQRAPGIPGARTGTIEPEELDDSYFMLRVRVDGGALSTEQLRVIGEISRTYARDTADITDRQNVQLHWIRVEDMPAIWQQLESVGLYTTEACGDCPRVVLGSPVAGVAADEIVDATPAIKEIADHYIGDESLSNLPRKFKTAISGSPRQDVVHETNDISFIGAEHSEHGAGFDLWVGGGLSTNPKLAVRLGSWVPREEVPEVWNAVVQIFRDYGYRKLRHRARMKFLVADWGAEKFREVLENEYLGRKLIDGDAPPIPEGPRDHVGVHEQRDGNYYVGVTSVAGRVSGSTLLAAADAAERVGSRRVRTTVEQNLLFLDVPGSEVETLISDLDELRLRARPSSWRRNVMACTGIEFCKLAIVETKNRATDLIEDLEKRLADVQSEVDNPVTVNLNGCPNACARTQVSDIGLKGQLVTDADGNQVEGFQVHLGGGLGHDPGFGRKIRGHKVTSSELGDYVERLVRRYLDQRSEDELFRQWVDRVGDEELK